MTAYYNEFDPHAAAWLRELIKAGHIADGEVDTRSIEDVCPRDLAGFDQCHFFAGIGGWSYALRLAGWDDSRPVWTGSCPCQPFSSASRGRGKRMQSDKHLWPHWFRLIRECRPTQVFGEQVANALDWLDQVADDLEAEGYAFWPCDIPACAVGADHIRHRIWFQGHTDSHGKSGRTFNAEAPWLSWRDREPGALVHADGIPAGVALKAFGNAIVPQVAAAFVMSTMQ